MYTHTHIQTAMFSQTEDTVNMEYDIISTVLVIVCDCLFVCVMWEDGANCALVGENELIRFGPTTTVFWLTLSRMGCY